MRHNEWVRDLKELPLQPSEPILSWLTKPMILSDALKRHYQTFCVRVLFQHFALASRDECEALGMKESNEVFVRQVLLEGDNEARTVGRVIVPLSTYHNHRTHFQQLDNKPIGETLLYHRSDVIRETFEYAFVKEIDSQVPFSEHGLWSRRSVFRLQNDPLLVTDLFLPTLGFYVSAPSR